MRFLSGCLARPHIISSAPLAPHQHKRRSGRCIKHREWVGMVGGGGDDGMYEKMMFYYCLLLVLVRRVRARFHA